MKKVILYFTLFFILSSCKKREDSLPNFNLLLLDSTTILSSNKIPVGKPIVLFFFSPDCEHCQAETEAVLNNIDSLKNVRFYFATFDSMEKLKIFNEYYDLPKYKNIVLGRDYKFFLPRFYHITSTPYTALYDSQKELKVAFIGETDASTMITEIKRLN